MISEISTTSPEGNILTKLVAILLLSLMNIGCGRTLSSHTTSQLWPRYLLNQSDLALQRQGFCVSRTHHVQPAHFCVDNAPTIWSAGYQQGFYQQGYDRLQPLGASCCQQPIPIPMRLEHLGNRALRGEDPVYVRGYYAGQLAADQVPLGGINPGATPLPSVSRVPKGR